MKRFLTIFTHSPFERLFLSWDTSFIPSPLEGEGEDGGYAMKRFLTILTFAVLTIFFWTTLASAEEEIQIAAGGYHTCVLVDGKVYCWGSNQDGQCNVPPLVHPRAISANGRHTCAIDDSGVHCWGASRNGQCDVPALSHPSAISAGYFHTCAIDETGVHCWGENFYGQLDMPTDVHHPHKVTAGWTHTCALDDNGIHCWGRIIDKAQFYRLDGGDFKPIDENFDAGQTTVPQDLRHPRAIAIGKLHVCALDDGGVHCWGAQDPQVPRYFNSHEYYVTHLVEQRYRLTEKERSDPTLNHYDKVVFNYGQTDVPSDLQNPRALTAGEAHTCVIDDTGVRCWGDNKAGQCNAPPLVHPVAVATGSNHTCAIDVTGVHCWGWNRDGQTDVPGDLNERLVGSGPFSLAHLETRLTQISERVYSEKAVFFKKTAEILSSLPTPTPTPTSEFSRANLAAKLSRLFILNALEPVFESIDSEYFTTQVMPRYLEAKARENERGEIHEFRDFFPPGLFRRLALQLMHAALTACEPFIGPERERQGYASLNMAIGRALAGNYKEYDIYAVAGVLSLLDHSRELLDQLTENHRTRGFGLLIQSMAEYLRI
ncbi:MAG: hypothetical protein HY391_06130 [Deltaproteobacteria bacterium]|nr:hypothetical protein [Deltaproteobacteria bacterium]